MKKKMILQVAALIAACSAGAQVVPNGNFEKWDSLDMVNNVKIFNPEGWTSYNSLLVSDGGTTQAVQMTTDAHAGSYAVRIQSQANSQSAMSGVLTSGDALDATQGLKFPIREKVDKIEAYYKYDRQDAADSAMVLVLFYLDDTQIGGAVNVIREAKEEYTKFSLQLEYENEAPTPNQAKIYVLSGSAANAQSTSVLYLDDLDFIYQSTTGVNEQASVKPLTVYPNPASDRLLLFNTVFGKNSSYVISDMQGKMWANELLSGNEINVAALRQGIYQVRVISADGDVYQARFIKE